MSVATNARNIAGTKMEIAARIAQYLRARHPTNTAKLVARDTGCALPTARRWIEGLFPDGNGLVALLTVYGRPLLRFAVEDVVFDCDPETADEILSELLTLAKARQAVLHREIVNEARDIAALRFVRSGHARDAAALADRPHSPARA